MGKGNNAIVVMNSFGLLLPPHFVRPSSPPTSAINKSKNKDIRPRIGAKSRKKLDQKKALTLINYNKKY